MKPSSPPRLYSLDALRGFDMFWIMGADEIVYKLAETTHAPVWQGLANQLTHPDWNGFHMYDLIFPLFLFIAGVATPYSVGTALERGESREKLMLRVVRRGLVLVILGIIYNNGLALRPLSEIRFPSVLGRIGIAYMFAYIIYLYTKERGQIIWFWGLLVGYWLLLMFTSAPGFPAGDLSVEGNFASYMDRLLLPGDFYVKDVNGVRLHDPEGLFSSIPAIATGLLGIFAGNVLKNYPLTQQKKTLFLLVGGVVFLALAQLWNIAFPINKNLWSSSFVLHVGGLSLIFLAVFYYIIDVLGYKKWAFFFTVIGMNSILIYMSGGFIDWAYSTKAFFVWLFQLAGEHYGVVIFAICVVFVKWVFLYILYRKKIFLRV